MLTEIGTSPHPSDLHDRVVAAHNGHRAELTLEADGTARLVIDDDIVVAIGSIVNIFKEGRQVMIQPIPADPEGRHVVAFRR